MLAVGLDGWRNGWIGIALERGRFVAADSFSDVTAAAVAFAGASVFAIDIPIGLPAAGHRRADLEARRLLGRRRSTVFLAPPRDVMDVGSYRAANELAKSRHGFGISRQVYALRAKILEVDRVARTDTRFHEVHPELAFMRLAGTPLPPKRSYSGVMARSRLLASIGLALREDIGPAGVASVDDVLDAAVTAWVGWRIAQGEATPLPDPPDVDPIGLPMAIWM